MGHPQSKKRYKMYKVGKKWCISALTLVAVAAPVTGAVVQLHSVFADDAIVTISDDEKAASDFAAEVLADTSTKTKAAWTNIANDAQTRADSLADKVTDYQAQADALTSSADQESATASSYVAVAQSETAKYDEIVDSIANNSLSAESAASQAQVFSEAASSALDSASSEESVATSLSAKIGTTSDSTSAATLYGDINSCQAVVDSLVAASNAYQAQVDSANANIDTLNSLATDQDSIAAQATSNMGMIRDTPNNLNAFARSVSSAYSSQAGSLSAVQSAYADLLTNVSAVDEFVLEFYPYMGDPAHSLGDRYAPLLNNIYSNIENDISVITTNITSIILAFNALGYVNPEEFTTFNTNLTNLFTVYNVVTGYVLPETLTNLTSLQTFGVQVDYLNANFGSAASINYSIATLANPANVSAAVAEINAAATAQRLASPEYIAASNAAVEATALANEIRNGGSAGSYAANSSGDWRTPGYNIADQEDFLDNLQAEIDTNDDQLDTANGLLADAQAALSNAQSEYAVAASEATANYGAASEAAAQQASLEAFVEEINGRQSEAQSEAQSAATAASVAASLAQEHSELSIAYLSQADGLNERVATINAIILELEKASAYAKSMAAAILDPIETPVQGPTTTVPAPGTNPVQDVVQDANTVQVATSEQTTVTQAPVASNDGVVAPMNYAGNVTSAVYSPISTTTTTTPATAPAQTPVASSADVPASSAVSGSPDNVEPTTTEDEKVNALADKQIASNNNPAGLILGIVTTVLAVLAGAWVAVKKNIFG
ncbi:MAG: KxYKxGKxW signal peptide domain-containing protein [Lactobacillaceae bacterium]|jgi:hypothetical protein|nr:KxYKxGKxW signal peptide domain-containing protein [Lactobacillaceae bacterium]